MAALLASGCAPLGMGGMFVPTAPHRLLRSTTELTKAAPFPVPLPRELAKQALPEYYVEPGDVLLVEPADFDSPARLPMDQTVLADGTIHLGRYGRLFVTGQTVDEIQAEVQTLIERQTPDPGPITVRLVGRESKVFYVFGEVHSPGAYPLVGRETVLDAIVAAGGLTNRANQQKIVLSQPTDPKSCRMVLPICYREIVQLGDTATNYQIGPGDRVFVPSLAWYESLLQELSPDRGECLPCGLPQMPCLVPIRHSAKPAEPSSSP